METSDPTKRLIEIGRELTAIQAARAELDRRTVLLTREAHRLTRPPELDRGPERRAIVSKANTSGLQRNGAPTVTGLVLDAFKDHRTRTTDQLAAFAGVINEKAVYAAKTWQKRGVLKKVDRGLWALTGHGEAMIGPPEGEGDVIEVKAELAG